MAAAMQSDARRCRAIFFATWTLVLGFRLWFVTSLPLTGDEAYHWEWSRHPAFGYYDHPGLTAYLIRFSTLLCGSSTEFSVRLPAVLLLSAAALLAFALAAAIVRQRDGTETGAARAGCWAGSLMLATPVLAVFSIYISTDPPLLFFWTLSLYLFHRAITRGGWLCWIGAGVALGLALLSKFLAFLLVPALGLLILLSPEDRKWLRRPHPYVAGLCTLLVLSPFLWWNATHGWATFMFNFVYRQEVNRAFAPRYAAEFIGAQALAVSPGLFLFALWGWRRSFSEWLCGRDRTSLFLGLTALVPLAWFLCVSFHRPVGAHWPAAGWIGMLVYLACRWATAPATERRWATRAFTLCVALTAGAHLAVHIPPAWTPAWSYKGAPRRIDTALQAERFGWRELGQRVAQVRGEMLAHQRTELARGVPALGVFVITGQYGLCAGVAFYTPDQIPTHLWAPRRRHGENYRFWDNFADLKGRDAVYVAKREEDALNCLPSLEQHFGRVGSVERLPIVVDGQEVRSFYLIRCYGFDGIAPAWGQAG